MEYRNSDALKAFLKKESNKLGISPTNTYNTYFLRQLLQRISEFSDREIIIKGSLASIVHTGKIFRPLTDLDLTSRNTHNNPLLTLYRALYNSDDNSIRYELQSLPKQTQTGIFKIRLSAMYGKIKHPLSIDFRENHPAIYEVNKKQVPRIFENDKDFTVNVPSYEETLAEKLCIIVESNKSNVLNTRVKDFYDIYKLHGGEYDFEKFSYFFEKMLKDRGKIRISDATTENLNSQFVRNHQQLWDNAKVKYEFMDDEIEFAGAVYYTRSVLSEQLQKIRSGKNNNITLVYKPRNYPSVFNDNK